MGRHGWNVAILWIALTAIGFVLVDQINIYPVAAAEEAHLIDGAFRLLFLLGLPVFTFVLAVLGYSVLQFRSTGPDEDGPPIYSNTGVLAIWLAVTILLALTVIVHPGFTGLFELWADSHADLVVQVEAEQWNWTVVYPDYGVTIRKAKELLLPVNQRIRFEITATDVVHSFWIPAFRMKIDAVPGMTTTMYVTPNREGTFDQDPNYRVQCAELCGTGHARMRMRVTVLSPADFEGRMEELQAQAARAWAQP